jgi:hypothetical protein
MYMKIIQACVSQNANHWEDDEDNVDTVVFVPTWLLPSYVPVVSTAHLVVRRLIGITCQARTSGTARTYPESEVAQWHAQLELLFVIPAGWAQSSS